MESPLSAPAAECTSLLNPSVLNLVFSFVILFGILVRPLLQLSLSLPASGRGTLELWNSRTQDELKNPWLILLRFPTSLNTSASFPGAPLRASHPSSSSSASLQEPAPSSTSSSYPGAFSDVAPKESVHSTVSPPPWA